MKCRLLAAALCCLSAPAFGEAWTLQEDRVQAITGLVFSEADHSYGSNAPMQFQKTLFTTYSEYGLRDDLTLFVHTESAYVQVEQGGLAPYHAMDNAVEAGARLRVDPWMGWGDFGVLSVEASLLTAGAFNFAVSANRSTGGEGSQLRLLYGRGFRLWDHDAFFNAEVAHRFLTGPRPDETPLDLTGGVWLDGDNMVMAQSFNLFAGAGTIAAYPGFRSHKLQFSWVRRLSDRFLVQAAGFFSPAGRNALVEQGACLSLWSRF